LPKLTGFSQIDWDFRLLQEICGQNHPMGSPADQSVGGVEECLANARASRVRGENRGI